MTQISADEILRGGMFFPICVHLRHLRMNTIARIGDLLRLGSKPIILLRSWKNREPGEPRGAGIVPFHSPETV